MDALKFAFDTLIVGALALPWLALFVHMFFEPPASGIHNNQFVLIGALPEQTPAAVTSVLVLALGYLLGSAVTRISDNFFNDELWHVLPTESSIRASVYQHEYCGIHTDLTNYHQGLNLPLEVGYETRAEQALCSASDDVKQAESDNKAADLDSALDVEKKVVAEFFRIQESRLLLAGEDKIARLREYHDQIVILRGSALNFTVLLVLSAFGICACYRANHPGLITRTISYIPAVVLLGYGVFSLCLHVSEYSSGKQSSEVKHGLDVKRSSEDKPDSGNKQDSEIGTRTDVTSLYRDPPLAELVLILLGITGLAPCMRTGEKNARLFRNLWFVGLVLSVISYGAWWWTEVVYDEQVIHSGVRTASS
jgi:hypothetical protein